MTRRHRNSPVGTDPRNPAEYLVLGVLAAGTAHGYDICRHLRDQLGGICHLGKSQVYALLSKMESEGLVTHEKLYQESLPARKMFQLTVSGRELLNTWVSSPVSNVRHLRVEFLTKLYFARMISAEVEKELLSAQLSTCLEKASGLERARNESGCRIEREALDYRLALVAASVAWIERLVCAGDNSQMG